MAVLRSLLFNLGFFAWTLLIAVLGLPFLILPYRFTYRLGARIIIGERDVRRDF